MNRNLGTKWFTFYTKVRPWVVCISTLSVVLDFFQYIDVYTSLWWMMLYFAGSVIQAVLAIILFIKSRGDYINFVSFVKGVLLFETINTAYAVSVSQYIDNGLEFNGIFSAVVLLILYFVWYHLNLKYFEKRILPMVYTANICEEEPCEKLFFTEPDNKTMCDKPMFCRKCGNKLLVESKFCNKCGTEIIEENNAL